MTISLAISLLVVAWLGICAFFDARTRQVSNWLTLPAIPLALVATWLTRNSRSETLYEFVFHLVIMTLPLFVAWRSHLLGGADLKILVVLTLVNPLLVVSAWIGVLIYFVGLLILGEWRYRRANQLASEPSFARSRPIRLLVCLGSPWAPGCSLPARSRWYSLSEWPFEKRRYLPNL